jgi:protein-disulfide isomerase
MPTAKKTSNSIAEKVSILNAGKYNPIFIVLLIIAAFFIGSLTTKLSSLQGGAQQPAAGQQGNAAQPTQAQADPNKKYDVSVGSYPVQGNKDAKVTIVEFADYQCPFCEKLYTDTISQIIKQYVDTGKAKFAYRDYAFLGQESTWASEATACANDQGKYWEFHDYLFTHQGSENSGALSKDNLKGFAATLGLNTDQFNSCLDTDKYAKQVADDLAAGQKVGVQGTPAVFVDGKVVVGAEPFSTFQKLIDQELSAK